MCCCCDQLGLCFYSSLFFDSIQGEPLRAFLNEFADVLIGMTAPEMLAMQIRDPEALRQHMLSRFEIEWEVRGEASLSKDKK